MDNLEEHEESSGKYITVCSCGRIVCDGKIIGMLELSPEYLMDEDREIILTFVEDSCMDLR